MNILVVGSGGREHAMVHALCSANQRGEKEQRVFAAPGSSAMAETVECFPVAVDDAQGIVILAQKLKIDLAVIGPEVAIAAGVSDRLRAAGIAVFGPSQHAGNLETSKIYAKEFMVRAGVPTAQFVVVDSVESTLQAASKFTPPYVLKADGLAAGKGVFICDTLAELESAAHSLFVQKELGAAGSRAVLEQFHGGYELSVLVLTNGSDYQILPIAQDHKRLKEGNKGPNTGGMGTVAPVPVSANLNKQIIDYVILPTLKQIQNEALLYRGVIFIGLMITDNGPMTLEYNVRFGDPETQVVLPLVNEDWGQIFKAVAQGEMPAVTWNGKAAACVVMASRGYPDKPEKGAEIKGLGSNTPTSYWLHAGTTKQGDVFKVSGGRVLNAVAIASSVEKAVELTYQRASEVQFDGMQFRTDIGKVKTSPSGC